MLKFSVIIPVYNTEKYLQDCIGSLLRQSYTCMELILIDDGSTDQTPELCDQYAAQYPGVVCVKHTKNQGTMAARLSGVDMAQGDVVVFVDSDDTLRQDALELLSQKFLETECDMVIFDAGTCSEYPTLGITHPLHENEIYEGDTKETVYRKFISSRSFNSVCLKATRRDCIHVPAEILQCKRLTHGEDLLLSACLVTGAEKITYINQGIYHYRARVGSATRSFDVELKQALKTVHNILERMVDQWGIPGLNKIENARKVSGWMDTLVMLNQNRHVMTEAEYHSQLTGMATDPYFTRAYSCMERSYLSSYYALLAFFLMHQKYKAIHMLEQMRSIGRRIKNRLKQIYVR